MVGKAGMIRELRRLRPFFFQTALRAAKDQFHGQSTYWASFLKNKDIDDTTRRNLEQELHQVNQKIVDAHASFNDVTEEVKRISELVAVGKTDAATGVKSDGVYDYGGENCIAALKDVLRFACGDLADVQGRKIDEIVAAPVLTDNHGRFDTQNAKSVADVQIRH